MYKGLSHPSVPFPCVHYSFAHTYSHGLMEPLEPIAMVPRNCPRSIRENAGFASDPIDGMNGGDDIAKLSGHVVLGE